MWIKMNFKAKLCIFVNVLLYLFDPSN